MIHTPGPWQVGDKDRNDQRQVLGPDGQLVAVVAHECLTSRVPEMEANAAVIAAAPDLLAALRSLLKHHECRDCTSAFHAENVEDAREAIARAAFGVAAKQNQPRTLGGAGPCQATCPRCQQVTTPDVNGGYFCSFCQGAI